MNIPSFATTEVWIRRDDSHFSYFVMDWAMKSEVLELYSWQEKANSGLHIVRAEMGIYLCHSTYYERKDAYDDASAANAEIGWAICKPFF